MFYQKASLFILSIILIFSCQSEKNESITNSQFLFDEEKVEKQIFEIESSEENTIEGKSGTVIFIPEGSFLDQNGDPVIGKIDIEVAEIYSVSDLIKAGISTISEDDLLQSEGIVYVNATADGQLLKINPDKPLRIEMPTNKKLPDAKIYDIGWDKEQNISWQNPIEFKKYLNAVDLSKLNFLPEGFEKVVLEEAPFSLEGLDIKQLADSLYLNLTRYSFSTISFRKTTPTQFQEGFSNPGFIIKNGGYTHKSFEKDAEADLPLEGGKLRPFLTKAVNPIAVTALKMKAFQNTLISTKEFEERMPYIHQTCDNEVLNIYVNNLDKNLWEIDELAAKYLVESELTNQFSEFANQKLTTVENGSIHFEKIQDYYQQELDKLENQLKEIEARIKKEHQKRAKIAKEKADEYKEILWQREKYRMERYGFEWSKTGWVGIARKVETKPINTIFENINPDSEIPESYIYVVIPAIQSIYKVNNWEGRMVIDESSEHYAIGVGYLEEQLFLGKKPFVWENDLVEIPIESVSKSQFEQELTTFNEYESFNQINVDLEYARFFHEEEQRIKKKEEEYVFYAKLRDVAFPCLSENVELGEFLFMAACSDCHNAYLENEMTGPALKNVHKVHTLDWLVKFTKNSAKMIEEGDQEALEIWYEWKPTAMPSFEVLSDSEIKAIYKFIESDGFEIIGE